MAPYRYDAPSVVVQYDKIRYIQLVATEPASNLGLSCIIPQLRCLTIFLEDDEPSLNYSATVSIRSASRIERLPNWQQIP